jgi:hypothetical protein
VSGDSHVTTKNTKYTKNLETEASFLTINPLPNGCWRQSGRKNGFFGPWMIPSS